MIWAAIIGAGLVTFLVRALPFAVTLPIRLPSAASRYLEALPVAIIAALVGPAVIAPGGTLTGGPEPLAALLAVGLVAWRRSLLVGVIGGVVAVALLRAIS
jgi:branched-subunit amino acid transport protein